MNILDRAITIISPASGLKRASARRVLDVMGYYSGASTTKRGVASWLPSLGSANTDLTEAERKMLIARSRDANRNQPLARAFITRTSTNIVGTGLKMNAQVDHITLGISEDEAGELNNTIEREWRLYAESIECDAERTLNFYGLQALILISAFQSGDCFVVTPYVQRVGDTYGTKFQVIESERVCNKGYLPDSKFLVKGVQLDRLGAPVAYHILRAHPQDYYRLNETVQWDVVPAFGTRTRRRRVFHLFRKERPCQVRGVPFLFPVLELLKQLNRYTEAELMATVVNSFFTVFVKTDTGIGLGNMSPNTPANQKAVEPGSKPEEELKMGYGNIIDLAEGESIESADPNRPNTAFEPFVMAVMRQIAGALEVPLDELLLNYQNSYSSARASMLQAWKFYMMRRSWLTSMFCQPAYELWFDEAVSRGRIKAPGYSDPVRRKAYTRASWIGPGRGAIDELKEAKASRERVEMGVSTLAIESVEMKGVDWESAILPQRAREVRLLEAAGIPVAEKKSGIAEGETQGKGTQNE